MSCLDSNIKHHYQTLLRFGINITKSREKASDLISEVYIDITTRGKEAPCADDDFLRWIYRYMKLTTMAKYGSYYKAINSKERPVEFIKDIPNTPEVPEPPIAKISEFKSSLDSLDQVLFELLYEKNYTYRKICELYGNGLTVQRLYMATRPLAKKIESLRLSD